MKMFYLLNNYLHLHPKLNQLLLSMDKSFQKLHMNFLYIHY